MKQLPDDISFERWVVHVFDHPIVKPQWWFHVNDEFDEEWDSEANPARTLDYLTRLFQSPGFLIPQYSRAQIDQGLNYLVSHICSNHMLALLDVTLPCKDRCECILAMSSLYADLMAPVYGNDLGHMQLEPGDPARPNFACYMWWDVIGLYGGLKHSDLRRLNNAVVQVFRETLTLKSEACLESVLHGCGHWHMYLPNQIEPVVRGFLKSRRDISPELRRYAECAARGQVQ